MSARRGDRHTPFMPAIRIQPASDRATFTRNPLRYADALQRMRGRSVEGLGPHHAPTDLFAPAGSG